MKRFDLEVTDCYRGTIVAMKSQSKDGTKCHANLVAIALVAMKVTGSYGMTMIE
jgi:hypothetical protein